MDSVRFLTRTLFVCAALAASALAAAQTNLTTLDVTARDKAAAAKATRHVIGASAKRNLGVVEKFRTDGTRVASNAGLASSSAEETFRRGPGDLTWHGGNTVASTTYHAIYLFPDGSVCTRPSCWGNVERFLSDFGRSDFIHVTDQYVGSSSNDRYKVGRSLAYHYMLPANPLVDADMVAVAHAAAVKLGGASGYGNMYHIFLAPEQDECFDTSYTICASNYFCAYHGSAVTDIGEIVYTVEPYSVGRFGCNVESPSPNGDFDDTYDLLSHETVEATTDPDLDAWWNSANESLNGNEIGDECVFLLFDSQGFYASSDAPLSTLNGHNYVLQPEYNNAARACTTGP